MNSFERKKTIRVDGKLINLSEKKVMGILNLTPDSFYDGGKYKSLKEMLAKAEQLIQDGADFIDVGGFSSRPGAEIVSVEEELKRVIESIKLIKSHFPAAMISIDTYRAVVAEKAIESGAVIINDISSGEMDKNMFDLVKSAQVPYIMMHMQGTPANMQKNPVYKDVVAEVMQFFAKKLEIVHKMGIADVIIDPGFGFGKTIEHNFELLKSLEFLGNLGQPIMAGLSHKSMINKVLNISAADSLNGTTVLNTIALLNGADIIRVHEVKEAKEAIALVNKLRSYGQV
jgi:dihydropteroate synthase